MGGIEGHRIRESRRPPLLPLFLSFSVDTICRSRRRKYDQIFATNKAHDGE